MFSPRGTLAPRPRGPNPSGGKAPGAFGAGGAAGPPRKAAPAAAQGAPQRFSAQEAPQWTGSQRINVRVTLHRADPRKVKEKSNLHQEQKGEPRANLWDGGPCPAGASGPKPPGPAPVSEQNSNPQNRYTPESASSILASFGLSNEDLEELSRYPDDQLTPENMPRILREIRIRKLGHAVPGLHAASRGEEPAAEGGAAVVKGKVIDYGHASKYGYTEDPLEICPYNAEALPEEPAEAPRGYNPDGSSAENREEFQREQSVPVVVPPPPPPSSVPCNAVFPAEELIKLPAFPAESSPAPSFFPAEPPPPPPPAAKVPALCGAAPAALPVVKPVSQPPMPPVLPPMLPALLPTPLPQPMLPPVIPTLVQPPPPPPPPPPPVSQHVLPPLTSPPFSAGLLAAISQHERKQRETGGSHGGPGASGGSAAGHKPFRPQAAEPIKSPFGVVKASWLPVFPDSQKSKRLPTPSMMNDYYATSPRIFPHLCSLCNVECTHMKDWILHQNNPAHLESCRKLRQQYPEWNPEAHSSNRNAADRKENRTPRHRSGSSSPGRRHSRPGFSRGSGSSGSFHAPPRYRSRSRSPRERFRRPRSRSPGRPIRRLSPRHRSRSPQRSRNPPRSSPRKRSSSSSERSSRRGGRSEDRKAALEAVMKTLGPGFLAEFRKHKSLQAAVQESLASGKSQSHGSQPKSAGNSKKTSKSGSAPKAPKKDGSSSKAEEPLPKKEPEKAEDAGSSKAQPPSYNRLLREDLLSCGTVLQISDLPDSGFSDQDIKRIVQPFGKVSDLIVLRSRNEAYLEMNYKEAVIAAVKFGEAAPVLLNGKRVRISVAERSRGNGNGNGNGNGSGNGSRDTAATVKKPLKKRLGTPKKPPTSTKKAPSSGTKAAKAPPGKKEKVKKAPAASEKKGRKSCKGPAKGSAEHSQHSQHSQEPGDAGMAAPEAEPTEAGNCPEPPGMGPGSDPGKGSELAAELPREPEPPEAASEEPPDPSGEDGAVLLLSDIPDVPGCSEEEISNLAKPFGGLRDLLILSSHRKALLETSRAGAEALLRFHSCFPMFLGGKRLRLELRPELRSLSHTEDVFLSLIKDSDPKADAASIREQLVFLGNLPDSGYRELEVVCVGLRFGKVEHYAVLSNRNQAILQLDSPRAARAMRSFLRQYPYSVGEHTLSCQLAPTGIAPQAGAGKKEPKREDGSRGSSGGWKKIPEGSGMAQRAAANPSGEPRAARKGPNIPEEIPEGQAELPESQQGGAARESPAGMDGEGADRGIGIAGLPAGTGAGSEGKRAAFPGAGKEEAHPEREGKKEDEDSVEPLESSSRAEGEPAAIPASGEAPGAVPGATFPSSSEAPAPSPGASRPSTEPAAPGKNPIPEAGKSSQEASAERRTIPKTPDAPGKKPEAAGAARGGKGEDSGLKSVGEIPGKISVKAGAEAEKPLGKASAKGGAAAENSGNAAGHAGSSGKIPPSKGMGAAKSEEKRAAAPANPAASLKESCLGKALLKAVVSVPDILKQRIPVRIKEPSQGKAAEQKFPPRAEPRGQTAPERKIPSKGTAALPGSGSGQWKGNGNSGAAAQGDGGRSSSQQEKDSQPESRAASKQCQPGESGTPGARGDSGGNQAPGGGGAAAWKSSGGKQREEEELFPFNLDEFVTVDEVLEEAESPVIPRRNPPRGKRKEIPKGNASEPAAKRRKGKSCGASASEGEPSFVTLDEIGEEEEEEEEEEDAPVPLPGADPQGLLVVDEVAEEEELSEAVRDPRALLTLDEISEQEEPASHGDGSRRELEERDLKAEPLVTVDEIGEVEELPLNEPAELGAEEGKANPGDSAACPDDPNALVTVDEIREDNEDNPLVTLDEVNEDEDDFLADFNHLKEELNFVTVDEVGDEEEENAFPGKNAPEDEDDEDIVAVAGPEEMGILGDANPEEEMAGISKAKAPLGSGGAEPKSQQKKAALPGASKTQSAPKALDILVPKAGFFCQICSLFYSDEASMISHCRTSLHRENMEKFMAKQQENGAEEPSSR